MWILAVSLDGTCKSNKTELITLLLDLIIINKSCNVQSKILQYWKSKLYWKSRYLCFWGFSIFYFKIFAKVLIFSRNQLHPNDRPKYYHIVSWLYTYIFFLRFLSYTMQCVFRRKKLEWVGKKMAGWKRYVEN